MVELTHQQVRVLLQTGVEQALSPDEKMALDGHVSGCAECRRYAENLVALQAGLRQMLHRRWDGARPSFSTHLLVARSGQKARQAKMAVTVGRLALVPLLVFLFLAVYQSPGLRQIFPAASAVTVPAPGADWNTPTPPARSTVTPVAQNCPEVTYIVQENDTLAGIAAHFLVSKAAIMAYNGMSGEHLDAGTALVIPLCSTSTPTTTTTITP